MDKVQEILGKVDPKVAEKLKEAMASGLIPTAGLDQLPEVPKQQKLTRQQRRDRERSAKKFTQRQTFTKDEVEQMNQASYEHGTAFALYAAMKILGLGEVRLDRIRMEIKALELHYFQGMSLDPLPFDLKEMNRYKGALPNAKKPAKK
ncbi:hypothetical protein ACF5W4_11235 [Bacillota bacterium Lsc_1132]